ANGHTILTASRRATFQSPGLKARPFGAGFTYACKQIFRGCARFSLHFRHTVPETEVKCHLLIEAERDGYNLPWSQPNLQQELNYVTSHPSSVSRRDRAFGRGHGGRPPAPAPAAGLCAAGPPTTLERLLPRPECRWDLEQQQ